MQVKCGESEEAARAERGARAQAGRQAPSRRHQGREECGTKVRRKAQGTKDKARALGERVMGEAPKTKGKGTIQGKASGMNARRKAWVQKGRTPRARRKE